MIKSIEIYDMDGTLVDSSHRYRLLKDKQKIDLEYWRKNDIPEKIAKDSLLPLAIQYKNSIANPEIYVIIATARVIKQADIDYIEKYLGMPNKLIGRKSINDTRKGADLKIQGLQYLNNLKQFKNVVKHFFEDNIDYLEKVCYSIHAVPHYIESNQGY